MRLIYKILLLSALLPITFISCSEEDDYTKGEITNTKGDNIYFSKDNASSQVLGLTDNEFTITVTREKTTDSQIIPIRAVTPHDSVFIVPKNVEFKAGESSQSVTIKTSDKMQVFKKYALTLTIPEQYTQQYSKQDVYSRIELTALKEDYKPYAEGDYFSDFFEDTWDAILEYSEMQDTYRFKACWGHDGFDVLFSLDGSAIKFKSANYPTGEIHATYGMITANPEKSVYDESRKTFTFNYKWTVSAGSFGSYPDIYTITKIL